MTHCVAIDPILPNILYTINLVLHLRAPRSSPPWQKSNNNLTHYPLVSVLLPVYKEKSEALIKTTNSLLNQTYPKDKLEIIFIGQPEDKSTISNLKPMVDSLRKNGFKTQVFVTNGKIKMKPHALNVGLKHSNGKVVVVYDADDVFKENQIEDAVKLMIEGYDVVQPKIFRARKSLVGRFLLLDSFVWTRKFLPALYDLGKVFPLSGEALFVRRDALDDVGGFPEVLTEDAYLALLLAEKGKRFALLDSSLVETAPKSWLSHFKQRLRWFRGYLQCLGKTLGSKLPWKKKMSFIIPFLAPLTCASSLITWIFLMLYWVTWAFFPEVVYIAPWMKNVIYEGGIFFWSFLLAIIGNIIVMFSNMQCLANTPMEHNAPVALVLPLYWMFIGVAAIASLFKSTKIWGKTER